jgi:uncharacterized protein (DUF2147 family)
MRSKIHLFTLFVACFYLPTLFAAGAIEGNWVCKDDKTGVKRAIIHLFVDGDQLKGNIDKVFPEPGDTGLCSNCPGDFKNKPIQGLQIIWGLVEKHPGAWEGGNILDAKTGKIYRAKMTVKKDKLYVRGYVGVSVLGRTQIWDREANS